MIMMEFIRTQTAIDLNLYEKGLKASTPGSAGIDLYVAEPRPVVLHATVPTVIATGLHLWVKDSNLISILAPRSSSRFRFTNTLGFIDSDYQGELLVRAISNSENDSVILEPGEKFAQLFIMPVINPSQIDAIEMDNFSGVSTRGSGGFGSTGNK